MRLFRNFMGGTTDDAPLADSAVVFNSGELAFVPEVVAPDTFRIVFDPEGAAPEVAIITDHVAAATSATILRGQEGTLAQEWPVDTEWDHAVTRTDLEKMIAPELSTIAATGAAEDLAFSPFASGIVHDVTMDEDATFTFSGAEAGRPCSMTVILRGAFTPTWPAAVDWADGTEPTYGAPAVLEFLTVDGGTTVFGFMAGASFA